MHFLQRSFCSQQTNTWGRKLVCAEYFAVFPNGNVCTADARSIAATKEEKYTSIYFALLKSRRPGYQVKFIKQWALLFAAMKLPPPIADCLLVGAFRVGFGGLGEDWAVLGFQRGLGPKKGRRRRSSPFGKRPNEMVPQAPAARWPLGRRAAFQATMPLRRFHKLSRALSFVVEGRSARRLGYKLAPIRDVWEQWRERLPRLRRDCGWAAGAFQRWELFFSLRLVFLSCLISSPLAKTTGWCLGAIELSSPFLSSRCICFRHNWMRFLL